MRHRLFVPLLLALCSGLPVGAAPAAVAELPWREPFAAIDATLAAAADVPADKQSGIVVLYEEARFVFDVAGRLEKYYRLVYRIDAESSIRGWSSVSRQWEPWHQERPQLRARVVSPDGAEAWLDPATLTEYADDTSGPDLYGDTRTYKGPLPTLKVGSVVEEEHTLDDIEPAFDAGSVYTFAFGRAVPVNLTRVVVDAPATLPLRHKLYLLPDAVESEASSGGRIRYVVDQGPLEARGKSESMGPGDRPRHPLMRLSTAASWNAVAQRYHEMVEQRLAGADLRKIAKKAIGTDDKQPVQVVAALLEEVQQRVRYTGIEFGEQAIVPTGPLQTLERGFGDCKDKATLLVGLLRAAGIPAHVALLDSGVGFDIDLELPGLGLFDHAIVYVPGPPATWIDPTHRFTRAGELPAQDQRRLALVAAPSTESPTLTPVATPAQNLDRERIEVFLANDGGARIVETTEVHGAFDRSYRLAYSKKKASDLRDDFERYVKDQYLAGELAAMELSSLEDLSSPLSIRLEATGCRRATTTQTEAIVYIPLGRLFSTLPAEVRPEKKEDAKRQVEEADAMRSSPLLLTQPYVEEWTYRIHPPAGYQAKYTPEDRLTSIGPAKLTQDYVIEADGTVTAKLTFDTVKDSYSPEEVVAIRQALTTLFEEQAASVTFQAVGETLLEAGNIKEALAEFVKLSAAHPEEPLHYTQTARAYLAAGLGDQARREARRAVALAPDSFMAHKVLGIVLAHDRLGRKFVDGFDLPGAEAELRRAIELSPDDFEANGELAILLEHDGEGERYGRHSRLDEAIAQYELLRTKLESENLTSNLMVVLAHTGRWSALRTLSDEAPRDITRDALRVAAFAALEGAAKAQEEANRLTGGGADYRKVLLGAADRLTAVRVYAPAAELMIAGSKGTSEAVPRLAQAGNVRKLKRFAESSAATDTPEDLVRIVTRELIESESGVRRVLGQFSPRSLRHIDRDSLTEQLNTIRRTAVWMLKHEGATIDQVLDVLLATEHFHVTRSDYGARVRLRDPAGDQSTWLTFYVARDGERFRIIGMTDVLFSVAGWVLALEQGGELDAARQWLDWLREDVNRDPGADPLDEEPIRRLWRPDGPRDGVRIRLAAATLLIPPYNGQRQFDLLKSGSEADLTDSERAGLDVALCLAADREKEPALRLLAATRLTDAYPDSLMALSLHMTALQALKRFDEADKLVADRLSRRPDDVVLRSIYGDLPHRRHDLVEWRKRLVSEVATGSAHPGAYNNLAWLNIVEQRVDDETLQLAQECVARDDYKTPSFLHTLATVFAEMGYVTEARDVVLALLDNRDTSELQSSDWYILGRIAEDYAAPEAAREYYAMVEAPEEPDPFSTYWLAVRRLELMNKGEAAASE